MGKYYRCHIICVLCLFLIFGGCDNKDTSPEPQAKSVVRKKIAPPPGKTPAGTEKTDTKQTVSSSETVKKSIETPPPKPTDSKLIASTDKTDTKQPESSAKDDTPPAAQSESSENAVRADKPAPSSGTDLAITDRPWLKSEDTKPNSKSADKDKKEETSAEKNTAADSKPKNGIQPSSDSEKTDSGQAVASLIGAGKKTGYDPKDKTDPFAPLFKKEKASVDKAVLEEQAKAAEREKKAKPKIKRVRRERTTPLEHVDLSQLKLVGVIRARTGNKALVEDANRKGYIVTKGTFIGIHYGKVTEILRDRIIVEEEDEDVYGEIIYRKRELKMQRPLGEQYHEL